MRIAHVAHDDYDQSVADHVIAVANAASAVDSPHLEPGSARACLLDLLYGWDNHGTPHVFLASDDDGTPMGYAKVELPRWDNLHAAFVDLTTAPDFRGRGVGSTLLADAESLIGSLGHTLVLGNAWRDSDRAHFWERHGYPVAAQAAQRRLVPADLDWPRLDSMLAHSLERSSEYDVVELPSPVPPEHIEGVLELQRAMNDAPIDDLDIEDEVWSEDRYREHEQALETREIRQIRLLARRRSDGAYGGFTVVALEDERPHLAFQEDTGVVGEHRGRRLGLRLKVEMLRLLRDRHPQIVQIDTWNAESNNHMIAVNDALGCIVVARALEVQRPLTASAAER